VENSESTTTFQFVSNYKIDANVPGVYPAKLYSVRMKNEGFGNTIDTEFLKECYNLLKQNILKLFTLEILLVLKLDLLKKQEMKNNYFLEKIEPNFITCGHRIR